MRFGSLAAVGVAGLLAIGACVAACGSNDGPGQGTGPTPGSSSSSSSSSSSRSGGTSSSSSSSGGGGGSSSSSSSGAGSPDAGAGADAGLCASTLQDKVTGCTGTEPTCLKGCGPDLAGGVSNNLGSKICSCHAGTLVYNCQACVYPQPLPACYAPASLTPPACAADVASKSPCTAPCGGVCALISDAGKTQGCVCVTLPSMVNQWTCATQWW